MTPLSRAALRWYRSGKRFMELLKKVYVDSIMADLDRPARPPPMIVSPEMYEWFKGLGYTWNPTMEVSHKPGKTMVMSEHWATHELPEARPRFCSPLVLKGES